MVHDWITAVSFLEGGRNPKDRPVQNNTRLVRRSDAEIAVQLHETDVVTYHRNGDVTLDSGGWLTVTTKDRINRFLGKSDLKVFSDRGRWFIYRWVVGEKSSETITARDGSLVEIDNTPMDWVKVSEFYDGITIRKNGTVKKPKMPTAAQKKRETAMAARIERFVDGFARKLAGGMPNPSNGDCWFCLFREIKTGRTWGDLSRDNEHLVSHMKDRYYVPVLAVNAVRERGYKFPEVILMMTENGMGGKHAMLDGFRRSLRRYLRKRLLPNLQSR